MRFRFCGDSDCPDWVLAEINSLSRLSSIKLKLLGQAVADSWIDDSGLNVEKIRKLLADSKLDNLGDLKATVACINFILHSAVRHSCDERALASELQQLGLPQEHSQALRRVYVDRQDILSNKFRSESLRVNRLEDVQLKKSSLPDCVSLELSIAGQTKSVTLQKADINTLLTNLKNVETDIQDRLTS